MEIELTYTPIRQWAIGQRQSLLHGTGIIIVGINFIRGFVEKNIDGSFQLTCSFSAQGNVATEIQKILILSYIELQILSIPHEKKQK